MIEIQIKDKKAVQITVVCLLLSLILLAALLCIRLVQWKDYVSVEAAVEDIYTSEGTPAHPSDRHTEVTYSFRLNGQNYYSRRTERFQSQNHIGEVRTIRCDPEHPEVLEDTWARNGLIVLLCGGTAILTLLLMGLQQDRRRSYHWEKESGSSRPNYF